MLYDIPDRWGEGFRREGQGPLPCKASARRVCRLTAAHYTWVVVKIRVPFRVYLKY